MANLSSLSAANLERRIADCRAKAEGLLGDLQALVTELGCGQTQVGVYDSVRGELCQAIDYIESAVDFLTADPDMERGCAPWALHEEVANA